MGREDLELLEYEQFYQIWTNQISEQKSYDDTKELLDLYRKYIIEENADTAVELMQLYTDRGEYRKAAFWQKQKALRKATNVSLFLDSIAKNSLGALKKVLAVNLKERDSSGKNGIEIDLSAFQEEPENVSEVLRGCRLMGYLCHKAVNTGYLTHFERLSVLYVFGHLGEDGKQFVHTVMSHTLNYQYNTTERFIRRIPEKPISCVKLREQYKQITAECGCSCDFKRSKNCYPSPVLHAILLSNDLQKDVTIPTSRTVTNEKEKKIMEIKKQKRIIDASIVKVEKELEKLFDHIGVDCLEIELGMLVRRRKDTGYEWLIEI